MVTLPSVFERFEDLVDSVELIPLAYDGEHLLGSRIEMLADEDSWYLIDKQNCKILRYSHSGFFLNEIGRRGNGPGEYLTIQNVQVSHQRICVFSFPDKIQSYDPEGNLLGLSNVPMLGDCSVQVKEGILTYYGYKPDKKFRLSLIKEGGTFKHFLHTDSYVLNLSTGEPVFSINKDSVFVIDAYSNTISKYCDEVAEAFLSFDFNKYRIDPRFFTFSNIYEGAEFLLKSDFARICRFFENDESQFAEIALQERGETQYVYAIGKDVTWRWFTAGKYDKDPLAGSFRLFDKGCLIAVIDPLLTGNMPGELRKKIINSEMLDEIPENNNHVIAKIHLR